jgi:hypothetical protein
MSIELEAYTAEGLLTGRVVADGRLVDMLTSFASIVVEGAVLTPFDGPPQRADGWSTVEVDELLAVVAPAATVTPFHAAWHGLTVDVGPYRIRGELPSLPGFDPARALARPSGSFIMVGRVMVELRRAGLAAGLDEHDYVWVNRYAVDAVSSDLELGFFFPGAIAHAAPQAIAG